MAKRMSATFYVAVSSKARNVSAMLTINNVVFISLTLPIVVCLFQIGGDFKNFKIYKQAKYNLVKVICIILMNTNCSVNIFIYSLMASEFRRQLYFVLKSLFSFKAINTPNSSSNAKLTSKSKSMILKSTAVSNGDRLESTGLKLNEPKSNF